MPTLDFKQISEILKNQVQITCICKYVHYYIIIVKQLLNHSWKILFFQITYEVFMNFDVLHIYLSSILLT